MDLLQFSLQPPSRPPGSSDLGPGCCCLRFLVLWGKAEVHSQVIYYQYLFLFLIQIEYND